MSDVYIKKYWDEEDILFYIHHHDDWPVRQIEISPNGNKFLSIEGNLTEIADQPLSEADYQESDIIAKEEFEEVWNRKEEQ